MFGIIKGRNWSLLRRLTYFFLIIAGIKVQVQRLYREFVNKEIYLREDKLTEIGSDSVLGLEHSEISPYYSWVALNKYYPHKRTGTLGNVIAFSIWCLSELALSELVNTHIKNKDWSYSGMK
jgi:hypothetical protein